MGRLLWTCFLCFTMYDTPTFTNNTTYMYMFELSCVFVEFFSLIFCG